VKGVEALLEGYDAPFPAPARIAVSTRMNWLKIEKETTHDLV